MIVVHMWHSTSLEQLEGFDANVTYTNTGQAARKKHNEREKNKLRKKYIDYLKLKLFNDIKH